MIRYKNKSCKFLKQLCFISIFNTCKKIYNLYKTYTIFLYLYLFNYFIKVNYIVNYIIIEFLDLKNKNWLFYHFNPKIKIIL